MSNEDIKLCKAVIKARKAFWKEIDGDTNIPESFGIKVEGLVKSYDKDVGKSKLVRSTDNSIGQELQKFIDNEKKNAEGDSN